MDLSDMFKKQSLGGLGAGDLEALELESDRILAEARKGITAHSEKKDYLSPSQLEWRRSREVYPNSGIPDRAFFSGVFSRAYNPMMKARKMPGDIDDDE